MTVAAINVVSAPLFDPGAARLEMTAPEGSTVQDIVSLALPGLTSNLDRVRVTLVTRNGMAVVRHERWKHVRPKPGVTLVIRVMPGKNALRAILSIVVAIAAIAAGQIWGAALVSATGGAIGLGTAQGLIGLGVSLLGNALINALIPQPRTRNEQPKPVFAISGYRNEWQPDGIVPDVLGTVRMAPPYAVPPYTEVVGDELWIRAAFNFGYGRLALSDFRIGDTSISTIDDDDIQMEVREGLSTDQPLSLVAKQVIEEIIDSNLVRPRPRDDLGNVIDGSDPVETPVVKVSSADASGAAVILQFPSGLCSIDDKGRNKSLTIQVRIRHRLAGASSWIDVETLTIASNKLGTFYRQHSWDFPTRGKWEIEVTRLTEDFENSTTKQAAVKWAMLQSRRPEYPINFAKPIALVAIRLKGTYRTNGTLDSFNALASRVCLDFNHSTGTWITRATNNPASLGRYVLQGASNARPRADGGLDLAQWADFHNFCRVKGLAYNRVHDFEATMREQLDAVCAAGRASARNDGLRYGVVIDRPRTLVIDHVNSANSYDFKEQRTYFEPPHAFRVTFLDETNDFQSAERIIPWPGHTGQITVTEQVEFPGITNPDQIWIAARRRMYELIYRPGTYTAVQSGAVRVLTRGDLAMANIDTLVRTQVAGRIKTVRSGLLELNERVTMQAGRSYGIRFKVYDSTDDTIGRSVVRQLTTVSGESQVVLLADDGDMPATGAFFHFGEAGNESLPVIISGIEAGKNMSVVLRMLDAAPIIDTLTDAENPPAWTGRVGNEIEENYLFPTAPRFAGIRSGLAETGVANRVEYDLVPGTGTGAIAARYRVQHRAAGGSWTVITIPVADGGGVLTYSKGTAVELKACSLSADNAAGPYSATVSFVVGSGDSSIPASLPTGIEVVGGRGSASIKFATGSDTATSQVQIYRTVSGVSLNRTTDAIDAAFVVARHTTVTKIDGDDTRANLVTQPSGSSWSNDSGWTFSSGAATHIAGSDGSISVPRAASNGKWYRVAFTISGYSGGTVLPRLSGGSNRNGQGRSADGRFYDRIQAVSGNNAFGFYADSAFAGTIDDVVLYLEGSESIDQGDYDYYLEPQNDDDVPGPVSGSFTVTII